MLVMYRVAAVAAASALALAMPFPAAALPDPVPFLPGTDVFADGVSTGGSFNFELNLIESPPPATTDARGVFTTSNATGSQPLQGLPGSKLGNTELGAASRRLQGLVTPGNIRPVPAGLGVTISGGPSQSTLEDPYGRPRALVDREPIMPADPNEPTTTDEDVEQFLGVG